MEAPVGRAHTVGEIGLPEVDKLLQGSRFTRLRNKNTLLQTTTPFEKPHPPNIFRRCQSLSRPSLDRISDLPDEVLEFILSLLPMREAAATSVLSRRWRDLWSVSASCFDFDLPNMTGNYSLNPRSLIRDQGLVERERPRFTRWIQRLLRMRTHSSSNVEALRISFIMGKESALHLNRWVTYAARHALRELELDFNYSTSTETAYDFPFQWFPCLQYLRLTGCNFTYPPNFRGFKSLISLTLIETFFSTTDTLQNILSKCSSLECLSLLHCFYFFESTDSFKLDFSGPSLRLKHLRLHMRTHADIRKIEVHDVNLLSLELYGFRTQLSIKNTPHLARLVACTGTPIDIQSDLPRLQTLFVTAKSWVKETILPNLSALKNLRRLVFLANGDTTHLLEVIRLLEACPLLQKLELDVGLSSDVLTQGLTSTTRGSRTLYTNLKEVEIFGFEDHPEKIELAIHLLKNAVVLERMDIFHISRYYIGDAQWILYGDASPKTSTEAAAEETQVLLKKVGKELQKEARPSTKLVLHPGNYTCLS